MTRKEGEFDQEAAQERLSALERLEALYRLREQAKVANRAAMLKSIEDLIVMERKGVVRDLDEGPASGRKT